MVAQGVSAPSRRLLSATLWIVAFVLMVLTGGYQRRTGPTYPYRGEVELAGGTYAFELVRKGDSREGARLELPDPGEGYQGEVWWRRYPTGEAFQALPLHRENRDGRAVLWAQLPAQPAAGKLEYYVRLSGEAGELLLPGGSADAPQTVVLRCKNHVPLGLLLPHILVMFLSMMIGLRTALGALFLPRGLRALTAWTTAGLTLGGMILGPLVQKAAFGALWTGWPRGYDLTDNKTLIMWLVWLVALGVVLRWPDKLRRQRTAVIVASLVMLTVYLIPHSLRGSELDYEQLDRGVEASRAIETG